MLATLAPVDKAARPGTLHAVGVVDDVPHAGLRGDAGDLIHLRSERTAPKATHEATHPPVVDNQCRLQSTRPLSPPRGLRFRCDDERLGIRAILRCMYNIAILKGSRNRCLGAGSDFEVGQGVSYTNFRTSLVGNTIPAFTLII